MTLFIIFALLLTAAVAILVVPVLITDELPVSHQKGFLLAISVLLFIGTAGIYAMLGAPSIIPLLDKYHAKMAEAHKTALQQSETVKANPKDLAAWVGLGQSYMQGGQYKQAAEAFKQAVLLSQGNPLIILAYASAMISEAGGKVTDEAKKSLEMVLLQQPENPEARYLLALRLLQEGKTQEAMAKMKELYRSLPEESPIKAMINKQIGRE